MMDVNERLIAKTFYFEYVLETYEAYVHYLMHFTYRLIGLRLSL
jgi:hypothetical protein